MIKIITTRVIMRIIIIMMIIMRIKYKDIKSLNELKSKNNSSLLKRLKRSDSHVLLEYKSHLEIWQCKVTM